MADQEYSASVQTMLRLRLTKVLAPDMQQACRVAREEAREIMSRHFVCHKCSLDNVSGYEPCEDPGTGDVLVDIIGDEDFAHSQWYDEDDREITIGAPSDPMRDALHEISKLSGPSAMRRARKIAKKALDGNLGL